MSGQQPGSADGETTGHWQERWPVGADRIEQWDADTLVFERRFSSSGWDAVDIAAAQRAYPECDVSLSATGAIMFVRGPVEAGSSDAATAERMEPHPRSGLRQTVRVSKDQVEAAKALIALRGSPEAVSPLIRKVAAAGPPPSTA